MVSVTNVDGSNPGPTVVSTPDTVQMPTGNLWKVGTFLLSLTPSAVLAATAPLQNFANTGIGLLTTDVVVVTYGPTLTPTANVAIANARVSAVDQLTIQFVNPTAGSLTPAAGSYQVTVFRVQPNWSAPASGNQLDW